MKRFTNKSIGLISVGYGFIRGKRTENSYIYYQTGSHRYLPSVFYAESCDEAIATAFDIGAEELLVWNEQKKIFISVINRLQFEVLEKEVIMEAYKEGINYVGATYASFENAFINKTLRYAYIDVFPINTIKSEF